MRIFGPHLPTEHGCTDPVYHNFLERNDASKVSTKAIFAIVSPPIGVYRPIIRAHSPRGWVEAYANITVGRAV
jgi:hypothetical protein